MSATEPIIDFLRDRGAAEHRHANGRSLLDHLEGTAAILRRWDQPDELVRAALLHSVYGTDTHSEALLDPAVDRPRVRELAGADAERLAFRFGTVPRGPLLDGTLQADPAADRAELDALVLLHIANLAEQAPGRDGRPGRWLSRAGEWAERIVDSTTLALPRALAGLLLVAPADETAARDAYLEADLAGDELGLALAAARLPLVGEPCVRLAEQLTARGAGGSARAWAEESLRRLDALGVAWDGRRDWARWRADAAALAAGRAAPATATRAHTGDPQDRSAAVSSRFLRWVAGLNGPGAAASGRVYPDLPATPFHDPKDFGVARQLAEHAAAIRDELRALDPSAFHRESERIARTGDWDVLFFYERGRRRDDVCAQCPRTAAILDGPGVMRTLSGLAYVSRLRPGTHIAAHRGPTNLRLRCHLGISVPDGDCAIRVGAETRHWSEGECLVFDDFLEHEAWNRTDRDRIVLIVDLWHPALSGAEIEWLQGVQRYAAGHAQGLERYWATNARARESSTG